METFEITIQRQVGEGWPVIVEQNVSGAHMPIRAEGSLSLDRDALVPIAGVLWARTERTRWAGTVLAVAALVVAVMVWRLLQLWEATGA